MVNREPYLGRNSPGEIFVKAALSDLSNASKAPYIIILYRNNRYRTKRGTSTEDTFTEDWKQALPALTCAKPSITEKSRQWFKILLSFAKYFWIQKKTEKVKFLFLKMSPHKILRPGQVP